MNGIAWPFVRIRSISGIASLIMILFLMIIMIKPGIFAPGDPYTINPVERLRPPSIEHPLGTDEMGRDVWTRIVHGTRITLLATLFLISSTAIIGGLVGMIAGYYGRFVDEIVMRIADLFLSFPMLILAIAIVAAIGRSTFNSILGLAIVWWAQYARIMRAQVLVTREKEFVTAAKAIGQSSIGILLRHILPNSLSPLIVRATLDISLAVLLLSALSFLGLGAQPPTPEWGAMIATGRKYLLGYWWYATFPGVAIFFTVLAFSLLGDCARELLDPKSRDM